jgi:hypothetical protein
MFKAKSERFDFVFLGISNLLKTYMEFIDHENEIGAGNEIPKLI